MGSRVVLLNSLLVDLFGSEDTADDALDRLRSALVAEIPAFIEASAWARGVVVIARLVP